MSVSVFTVPSRPDREKGTKLIDFLTETLGLSRKKTKAVIDSRRVFVNRRRAWMSGYMLKAGDRVEVEGEVISSAADGVDRAKAFSRRDVLFEDEHYIVVSKPTGIESEGEDGLEALVRKSYRSNQIRLVHRLDRDTSGALIFAVNQEAFEKAVKMFKDKKIQKKYLAVVLGECREKVTIEKPVNNALALSRITKIIASNRNCSLIEVEIETGRKHQVRVHLASIGHPVAGETKYFSGRIKNDSLRRVPRQLIHSCFLGFEHPYTGKELSIRAQLPNDFKKCLDSLGLSDSKKG